MVLIAGTNFRLEVSDIGTRDWLAGFARQAWLNTYEADDTARDVDFLFSELPLASAATVLDVGCAQGRHMREIARRKRIAMCGIDSSGDLIDFARSSIAGLSADADYFEVSVENVIRCEPLFDCAYSLGTSFGYHADFDLEAWLESIRGMLAQGGWLLLETVLILECFLGTATSRVHDNMYGNVRVQRAERVDWEHRLLRTRYTYSKGDLSEKVVREFKIYPLDEFRQASENAGFFVAKVYNRERRPAISGERSSRYGFLLRSRRA